MEFYIYRHIRLDKNEPFYIGKGHNKPKDRHYERAFHKKSRNPLWKNIVNKTTFDVDIIFTSNDEIVINEKEKEFIKLYGRINNGSGTLANFTDGAEGTVGYIMSEDAAQRNRIRRVGKRFSNESKIKMSQGQKLRWSLDRTARKPLKAILQYSLDGVLITEWPSIRIAANSLGISEHNLSTACRKLNKRGHRILGGYYWMIKNGTVMSEIKIINRQMVLQYDIDRRTLIKEWLNAKEASIDLGFNHRVIRTACRNGKPYYGFYWKYKLHQ